MNPRDVQRLLSVLLPALALVTVGCDDKAKVSTSAVDKSDGSEPKSDSGKPPQKPATCPSGDWCAPKIAALRIAGKRTPTSLGCPPELNGDPKHEALASDPVYEGLMVGSTALGATIDEPATEAKRATGDADTCCYKWIESCPGGRPLLDDDHAPVRAVLRPGDAWTGDRLAIDVPQAIRARAAAAWLVDAAMEHASVASFSRAAIELLALGAPPALLAACHQAALDEIGHARTCLAIAVACGAAPQQPGPVDVPGPRGADLAALAATTFLEGCVGETTAALVMERAASRSGSPALREALVKIAADEADHAALAWRTLQWAVNEGGAPALEALRAQADAVRTSLRAASLPVRDPDADALASAGRLDSEALHHTRADAWQGIIEPMLARLIS